MVTISPITMPNNNSTNDPTPPVFGLVDIVNVVDSRNRSIVVFETSKAAANSPRPHSVGPHPGGLMMNNDSVAASARPANRYGSDFLSSGKN